MNVRMVASWWYLREYYKFQVGRIEVESVSSNPVG